ncbi:hypothetical protein ACWCP6_05075 [Streptomyces sp. NPDC002004]
MSHSTAPCEERQDTAGVCVPDRAATVFCAALLVAGHLATGFVTVTAYMISPAGPWDTESVAHSGFAAGLAIALATVAALLTLLFLKAEWLARRWWYAPPVLLAAAALLRLTVLAPEV